MHRHTDWPTKQILGCIGLLLLSAVTAEAGKRRPANVPAADEIEVISPNVDPLDRPAAVIKDWSNGLKTVDIPPTVLVHKYYYTGDRSFQAQLLPGGPSIVVVNHPKTGERCYIEMQMLPGAPRVTYTSHSIERFWNERTRV